MWKDSWHAFSKQENILQLHENVLYNGFHFTVWKQAEYVLNEGILDETGARLGTW